MYKIKFDSNNAYKDITPNSEAKRKEGFYPYKKSEVTIGYDIRTNRSKSEKIKMKEIVEQNNKNRLQSD